MKKTIAKRKRDFAALEKRRRAGMALLAKGIYQAEVSRIIGVSRMTVLRWERLRAANTVDGWKCRRLGRPPLSPAKTQPGFNTAIKKGTGSSEVLKNLEKLLHIEKVLKRESGVHVPPVQLLQLLKEHGWECLSEKSLEADEEAGIS